MASAYITRRGGAVQTSKIPEYTYTGDATLIQDDEKNWRIKFYTSGTFSFTKPNSLKIDAFLVGGGGGGGCQNSLPYTYCGGGGGGGYILTENLITLQKETQYEIIIGAGGSGGFRSSSDSLAGVGYDGGKTTAFNFEVTGGGGGGNAATGKGGAGSSNGGAGGREGAINSNSQTAGSDGVSSENGEFGDPTAEKYASGGGGAGGSKYSGSTKAGQPGGYGGMAALIT